MMTASLNQAKSLFPNNGSNSTTAKMTAVMDIISQIKDAVKNNDMMKAQTLGTNLDEAIDPLKDVIKDKNPDLVKSMDVEVLMDMMKETSPDMSKINSTLASMNQAMAQATKLF